MVLGFFIASFFALQLLVSSPFGKSLVGIRERELRMRILGYNTWLHKYIAFVIAGAFGGLAGVLWAHLNGIVSPTDVLLPASVDVLLMVVLGGPGTLVGGLIGATVVVFLREYLARRAVVAVRARRGLRARRSCTCPAESWVSSKEEQNDEAHCGVAAGRSGRSRFSQELKIGFLAPMTGPFSQIGKDMENGFQMYLDEQKGNFAGAKVTFIVEDEEGKPPVGVRKAEKLARQDNVHMLVGGLLASTGYAIAPVSSRLKTVYVLSIAAADDLTQRDLDKYPYIVRTSWTSCSPPPARQMGLRERLQDRGRHRRRLRLRPRGARRLPEGVRGLRRARGAEDLAAARHQGLRPYIPTIKRDADAIFSLMGRADGAAVQAPEAGIKKPIIGGGTSYDEFVLPAMGDEVLGHFSALQYSAALDTPKNREFVRKYREKYGKVPSCYSE